MNVSAGLEDGCRGGILLVVMPLFSANLAISNELNGGPLSEIWVLGFPRVS